jgi:glycine/D-amino acid oxidase-like deaminating enzyme
LLTACQLRSIEPNLADDLAGALLVPEDAVVYPPTVALYLVRRAQQLGAQLLLGRTVRAVRDGVVTMGDSSEIRAQRIIVALGAESATLMPDLPLRKRKGHLVITDRYPGYVHHQLVELGYLKSAHNLVGDSVAFNVQPRKTGQLLIGSSRQFGAEGAEIDQHILSAMLQRAAVYLPGISALSAIRAWTGFRAATPDKLPLIGPHPLDPSIVLATGHEGLGITTSLATAELIADRLTHQNSAIASAPYAPSRQTLNPNESTSHQEDKHEVDWSHAGIDHGLR